MLNLSQLSFSSVYSSVFLLICLCLVHCNYWLALPDSRPLILSCYVQYISHCL